MYPPHDSRLRTKSSCQIPKFPNVLKHNIELRKRVQSYLDQFEKGSLAQHYETSIEPSTEFVHHPCRMFPEVDECANSDVDSSVSYSDTDSNASSSSKRTFDSNSAIYYPSECADSQLEDSEDTGSLSGEGELLVERNEVSAENISEEELMSNFEDPSVQQAGNEDVAPLQEVDGSDKSSNGDADATSGVESALVGKLTAEMLALHLEAEETSVGPNRLSRYMMSLKLDQDNQYNNWIGGVYHPMWLGNASSIGQKRGTSQDSALLCPFMRNQHLDIEYPQSMLPIPERKIARLKRASYRMQRKWSKEFLRNGGWLVSSDKMDCFTEAAPETRPESHSEDIVMGNASDEIAGLEPTSVDGKRVKY